MADNEDAVAGARTMGNESMVLLDAPPTLTMKQFMLQQVESRIASSLQQAAAVLANHLDAEASARATAAERKAAYVEQELMNVKEQALSMLLNLKQTSDSKVRDLEKQVSTERQRAEEAETKVLVLQELVQRLKSDMKKKGPLTSEEENEITDSLFLFAGVACDVAEEHREDGASTSADAAKQRLDEERLRLKQQQEADDEALARATGAAFSNEEDSDEEEEQAEEESSDEEYPKRRQQARKRKGNNTRRAAAVTERPTTRFVKRARSSNKQSSSTSGEHNTNPANVVKESSRDNRRLMQGARQLFSLTEQKWR